MGIEYQFFMFDVLFAVPYTHPPLLRDLSHTSGGHCSLRLPKAWGVCVSVCVYSHVGLFLKVSLNTQTVSARLTMERHAQADSPSHESLH